MKKKKLTIVVPNKLRVDNEKDDQYALSYIIEEEDGSNKNLSSWHPVDCKDGLYNVVEYYIYTESDLCLEIKNIVSKMSDFKMIYMNGPDFAVFEDTKTEKTFTFKVGEKGISINNTYLSNKKNIVKFLKGLPIIF